MPRNLNEIVRSRIRLLDIPHCAFPIDQLDKADWYVNLTCDFFCLQNRAGLAELLPSWENTSRAFVRQCSQLTSINIFIIVTTESAYSFDFQTMYSGAVHIYFLFRGTAGILSEITLCFVFS